MTSAMRRVPQFEDVFAETLVTNVVKLPDRSALDAWNSFDLNFIANPFKQMAEADNAHYDSATDSLAAQEDGRPRGEASRRLAQTIRSPREASASWTCATPGRRLHAHHE